MALEPPNMGTCKCCDETADLGGNYYGLCTDCMRATMNFWRARRGNSLKKQNKISKLEREGYPV
jgi:hypothetical protein